MSQTSHKYLDVWYKNREQSTDEERKRIERTVAKMKTLKQWSMIVVGTLVAEISTSSDKLVPETLVLFTSTVTQKKTGNAGPDISRKRQVITTR